MERGHPPSAETTARVDAQALAAELRGRIKGEVRFDEGSRALYATDASNYRQPPIGVIIPRDLDDVVRTVAAARRFGAPILARGGGTSIAGQCCNVAVVLDFTKYLHHVLEIDPGRRLARVQPGTPLDDLRDAAKRDENLMPYFLEGARAYATVGEMTNVLKEVFGVYRDPGYF